MRLTLRLSMLLCAVLLVPSAWAHGPTPQRLTLEANFAAAPEDVWLVLGDLSSLASWHPQVVQSPLEGDRARGARRTLVFEDGGQVVESVDDIDDVKMSYSYRLKEENVEVFPASFYSNTISVMPDGEGAQVVWRANFFRADTGNYPSESHNDAAAVAAMRSFIETGLDGLRGYLEK